MCRPVAEGTRNVQAGAADRVAPVRDGREVRIGAGAAPRASRSIAWLKVRMFFNSLAKRTCMNVAPPGADVRTPEAAVRRALAVLTKRKPGTGEALEAVHGIRQAARSLYESAEGANPDPIDPGSMNDMQLLRLRGRLQTAGVRNLRAMVRLRASGEGNDFRNGMEMAERLEARDLENTFRLLEDTVNGELVRRGFRPGSMKPVPEGRDHPAEREILDSFIANRAWRYGAGKGALSEFSLRLCNERLRMANIRLDRDAVISGRNGGVCDQFYADCNRLEIEVRLEEGEPERVFPVDPPGDESVLRGIDRLRELCGGDAKLLRNVSRYTTHATVLWDLLFHDKDINPVSMADGRRCTPYCHPPRVDPRAPSPSRFLLSRSRRAGAIRMKSVFEPRYQQLMNEAGTSSVKLEEGTSRGRFVLEMDITRHDFRLDPAKCTYEYAFKVADGPTGRPPHEPSRDGKGREDA